MKIRTDFVTNSSSTSSVCIRVKSEKLARLLDQYRHLFGEDNYVRIFSDGILVEEGFADCWAGVPRSMEQLMDALLAGLKTEVISKFAHSPQVSEVEQQIKDRRYAQSFHGKLGEEPKCTGRILAVGIAYNRKDPGKRHTCKVEVLRERMA